jgi:Flp pilus assembly pilin Flp
MQDMIKMQYALLAALVALGLATALDPATMALRATLAKVVAALDRSQLSCANFVCVEPASGRPVASAPPRLQSRTQR